MKNRIDVEAACLSGDGGRLLVVTGAGELVLFEWPGATARRLAGPCEEAPTAPAFSPEGDLVFVVSGEGRGCVVDLDGNTVDVLPSDTRLRQGCISKQRQYLTLNDAEHAVLWRPGHDGPEPTKIADADGSPLSATRIALFEDGAAAVLMGGFDWLIWDAHGGHVVARHQPGHTGMMIYMDGLTGLSRSGRYAWHYWDDYLVWNAVTAEEQRVTDRVVHPRVGALSDDGRVLVLGGDQGQIWSLDEDGEVAFESAASTSIRFVDVDDAATSMCWVDATGGCAWIDLLSGAPRMNAKAIAERLA